MLNLLNDVSERRELAKSSRLPRSLVSTPGNPFTSSSRLVSDSDNTGSAWVEAGEITSERIHVLEIVTQQLHSAKRALDRAPNSPFLMNSLGLSYLNAGKIDEAVHWFERALELKPDLTSARLNLAKAQVVRGDLEGALSTFTGLLEQHPRRSIIHESLGEIYLRLALVQENKSYLENAERHFKEVRETNPSSLNNLGIVCMLQGQLRSALGSFKKALTLEPASAKVHFNIATCYAMERNYGKAARHFTIALSLDKHNLETAKGLARIYLIGKSYVQAVELLSEYEKSFSNDTQLLELLGEALFYTENYKGCLRCLSRVEERIEDSKPLPGNLTLPQLYHNLGCVHNALGSRAKAELYFKKSITSSSNRVTDAYYNLVDIYLEGNDRFEEALPLLQIIENNASSEFKRPGVRLRFDIQAARYHSNRNEYDIVLRYLVDAKNTEPTNPFPYIGIGYMFSEINGDYDRAIETIKAGLVHAPTNIMLLNNLAYNYLMKGNIEKGRKILDSMSESEVVENPYLLATRGLLLVKEGALEEGARLYNQASQMITNEEMRAQVRQKKNLEIGRYFLGQGKTDRAKKLLGEVLTIDSRLELYQKQASILLSLLH